MKRRPALVGLMVAVVILGVVDAWVAVHGSSRGGGGPSPTVPWIERRPVRPATATKTSSDPLFAAFRTASDSRSDRNFGPGDPRWRARMTALAGFARRGQAAVPTLVEALDDKDEQVRALAAQALGYIADQSVGERLDRVLRDDASAVARLYAAQARGRVGGMKPGPFYERLMRFDPDWTIRAHVDLALALGPEPRPREMTRALAEFDPDALGDSPKIGEPAPDFTLTDLEGRPRRLGDYRGKSPVVVAFLFSATCMFCRGQALALEPSRFEALGAEVLVVEPHEAAHIRRVLTEGGHAGPMPGSIVTDPSFVVSASYGVAFQIVDHVEWSNRPAVFIVDQDGIIRFTHHATELWDRPSLKQIMREAAQIREDGERSVKTARRTRREAARPSSGPLVECSDVGEEDAR